MVQDIKEKINQFVVFTLAGEFYGVEINKVREIINMQCTTQVPGATDFIVGIINLRGYVIPIFSIRKKFNLGEGVETKNSRIVVVEVSGNIIGIIVDEVAEVLSIPAEIIEKPSSMIKASISNDYIRGIAKLEEKLVIMLDLERAIGIEEKCYQQKII